MRFTHILLCSACILLVACGTKPLKASDKHIQQTPDAAKHDSSSIPQTSKHTVVLPPPKPVAKVDTYSMVFSDGVPVRDVLFVLARDSAKINIDIKDGDDLAMSKKITLNAINQTLPQILERLAKQSDIYYEFDASGNLLVMPDKPFLKAYKIDFINMSREVKINSSISGQITGGSTGTGTGAGSSGNSTTTTIESKLKNNLMDSLIKNVENILLEEDRLRYRVQKDISTSNTVSARGAGSASGSTTLGSSQSGNITQVTQANDRSTVTNKNSGSGGEISGSGNQDVQGQGNAVAKIGEFEKSNSVFANNETGVLLVRATHRQHEEVQKFVDMVMKAAKRQLLIEATIVEVQLSDQYKQGIDWSRALLGAKGFALSQAGSVGIAGTAGALAISYINPTSKFGNIAASVELLEKFGNVKVLSSPKLTVMNNQTASLRVAKNAVFFNVTSTPPQYSSGGAMTSPASFTTTPQSVSVGLTMTVTPQISDADTVTLNVRPAISSITSYINDPNPGLANPCGAGVTGCTIPSIPNLIPEIQTREMESILKIENGQTAVMGGLIKEEMDKNTSEVPFLARIPLLGNLFQNRNDTTIKTELVIFLRPVVLKDASINGDFAEFRNNLPTPEFFNETAYGSKP